MTTFLLTWNPAIDEYQTAKFHNDIQQVLDGDNINLYWPINDYKHCKEGDRFFMLRTGRGHTGICMAGYFSSDPFEDEGVYRSNIDPLLMVDPEAFEVISLDELSTLLPDVDWKHLQSGTRITEEQAGKLEEVWLEYLYKNLVEFEDETNSNAVMSWDFDIEDFESVPPSLQILYKKKYGDQCEKCGRHEEEVEELAYHIVIDGDPSTQTLRDVLHCYCNDCWF